ncbi:hypothetical protein [Geodermatophilus sp. SYSU D00696]
MVLRVLPWAALALTLACTGTTLAFELSAGGRSVADLLYSGGFGLSMLGFAVVGAVLASRRPANPVGWLCAALALVFWSAAVAGTLLESLPDQRSWPLELVNRDGWPLVTCLAVLTVLLFPTGRPPSPGWRWLQRAALTAMGVAVVSGIWFPSTGGDSPSSAPWATDGTVGRLALHLHYSSLFVIAVSWFLAMASVGVRYHQACPDERRQLKWFLLAVLLNIGQLAVVPLAPAAVDAAYQVVVLALIPVSIGIAVLRYRLYEIDRIVSRTVSYAVLTGALLVLYLAAVTALRPLLTPVTGTSDLAVVVSTLAVAAVFGPARRRVQDVVDRRFDRTRYDASRAVEDYRRRLRSEVDLDAVTAGLRETVSSTVGPQRLGLWLRDDGLTRRA